jgi:hypothetical protein
MSCPNCKDIEGDYRKVRVSASPERLVAQKLLYATAAERSQTTGTSTIRLVLDVGGMSAAAQAAFFGG